MESLFYSLPLCSWCVLLMLWMSCTGWWKVLSRVGGRLHVSSQPVERLESGCSPWPRSFAAAWERVTSSCVTAEYTGQSGLHTHTLKLLCSLLSDRHQAFARDSKWNVSVFSSPVFFPFCLLLGAIYFLSLMSFILFSSLQPQSFFCFGGFSGGLSW